MRFSIVTPNYNYGRFLRKALESVLSQVEGADVADLSVEHIVIDGGSTDDSVAILNDWSVRVAALPPEIAVRYSFSFVSEPDKGQTDAINKGLLRASGDIVAWLNADEYYLPGKLPLVDSFFASHPEADFVYGEPLFVSSDLAPIRVKWDHWFSRFVLLCHDCHIASCCAFWRRNLLASDGFLDESNKVAMDYEYWCRLVRHGRRVRFLPHVIGAFIWHDANVSRSFAARGRQEVRAVKWKYSVGIVRLVMRTDIGMTVLDVVAHQWRRVLVLLRRLILPCDAIAKDGI